MTGLFDRAGATSRRAKLADAAAAGACTAVECAFGRVLEVRLSLAALGVAAGARAAVPVLAVAGRPAHGCRAAAGLDRDADHRTRRAGRVACLMLNCVELWQFRM